MTDETTSGFPDSGEGDDQDSGPATTPDDVERAQERDRAEGDPDVPEE